MTDIDMHLIKTDILEMMGKFSSSLKTVDNPSKRESIVQTIWKMNRSLQLIDFMEQRIVSLDYEIQLNASKKATESEYRIMAIEQSATIERLNKTIVGLVEKLDKKGGFKE